MSLFRRTIIHLEPGDNNLDKVSETALAVKQLFNKLKLTSYVKTSGKTGLHLLLQGLVK